MKKVFMLALSILVSLSVMSAKEDNDKPYKAYLVSTAHFDAQWNWDVQESLRDYLYRTMAQNFWLFENFPEYVFNFESAQKYSWMKEYYPEEFKKVREYVRQGRWNVCGSSWEATDPNMPSSESFFRNLLLGQTFFKEELGTKANDIYLPDCFGFGYTLPTIASHCGLKGFSTQKLQWRKNIYFGQPDPLPAGAGAMRAGRMPNVDISKKIPFPIGVWQGIDGSRIMAVLDAGGYGTAYQYEDITNNQRIISRAVKDPNGVAYSYYGVGDRGGSPTLPSVWSVVNSLDKDGQIKVIAAKAGQLYEDFWPLEKHPELPVYDGELIMDVHGVGCYTSQSVMKRFNRRNEHLADAAERASVAAELLGGMKYPVKELRENWQRFIWHQFHDDLTGTSIPRSYTFSWNDEIIAQSRFADAITVASGAVSRALDTQVAGMPVVVYNPVACSRKDIVEIAVPSETCPSGVVVTSDKGKTSPAQISSWENGIAKVIFIADVAPVSYSVYSLKFASKEGKSSMIISKNSIENSVYKILLDENGDFASIYDKRNSRELVADGKPFRLVALTENVSKEYPAWEIYKTTLDGPEVSLTDLVSMEVVENGPVRSTVRVERRYDNSQIVQYISLTEGACEDEIVIANDVEWRGLKTLLKAEFSSTVNAPKASYDLGLGYIQRGNNSASAFEVPGHKWADLSTEDSSYGFTVLNDCKYGWDKPADNTIRLTLFHTPFSDGSYYSYQETLDHGHHNFKYAILAHKGDLCQSNTENRAECFNQPLLAFQPPKHPGKMGRSWSLAKSENPAVVIKAIKKAEDGKGYIVRINEEYGKTLTNASVSFAYPIASAEKNNGLEEYLENATFSGNTLTFDLKPFQPMTFRVEFDSSPVLDIPGSQALELPYNTVALTVDQFNRAGNFDRAGNSFAQELMPEEINSDGVVFKMNNDASVNDCVRCNGQEIALPEGHKDGKLFILATSIKDDRIAAFKIDTATSYRKIPYFAGFYGQWSWNGHSEAYVKDAKLGYVANHKHCPEGNDFYSFAYLYKIELDAKEGTKTLTLPKDAAISVFAVTYSENPNYDLVPLQEMRALPKETKAVRYENKPMPFFTERGAW